MSVYASSPLSLPLFTLSLTVNRDQLVKRARRSDTSLEQSPVVKAPYRLEYLRLQRNTYNEQVASREIANHSVCDLSLGPRFTMHTLNILRDVSYQTSVSCQWKQFPSKQLISSHSFTTNERDSTVSVEQASRMNSMFRIERISTER